MREAEREEERWALFRVPETARLVEELHGRGEPVIYTTDMYLPEAFLREILVREGLWREGDRLYLSCLQGVGKNRGLFRLILERENLPSEELLHTGDNREADLVAPQRERIPVRSYTRCSLTKREALLADDRPVGHAALPESRNAGADQRATAQNDQPVTRPDQGQPNFQLPARVRWRTSTRALVANSPASHSAMCTERCWPPVQPMATVR